MINNLNVIIACEKLKTFIITDFFCPSANGNWCKKGKSIMKKVLDTIVNIRRHIVGM